MLSSHPDIAAEAMAEEGADIADNEEERGDECGGERGGEGRRGDGDGVGGREEERGEGEGDVLDPTHLSIHPEDTLVSLRSCEALAAAVMGYLDRAHIVGQAHLVCR